LPFKLIINVPRGTFNKNKNLVYFVPRGTK